MREDFLYEPPKIKNYEDLHSQTKKVLEWIGNNKEGIEIGCHTGHLAEWLQKKDCNTIGIDNNKLALNKAEPFLIKSIFTDVQDINFIKQLKYNKYDYITFLHVLEHLKNPQEVLNQTKELLKKDGIIIIGLPNISNAKDRFNMFFGRFEYTDIGVMDKTHIHFFNYYAALKLIDEAGLKIIDYFSPWQVNPIREFIDHLPILWVFKYLFKKEKPSIIPFSTNIKDVTMLFKCKLSK